jgi:hypothetical protein
VHGTDLLTGSTGQFKPVFAPLHGYDISSLNRCCSL